MSGWQVPSKSLALPDKGTEVDLLPDGGTVITMHPSGGCIDPGEIASRVAGRNRNRSPAVTSHGRAPHQALLDVVRA